MRMTCVRAAGLSATLSVGLSVASLALAADQPTFGPGTSPPPDDLSEEIRSVLNPEGLVVTLASGTTMEFWFLAETPAGDSTRPGGTFPELGVGTLVGAVRTGGSWTDYKGNPIEPGVFTLRYGMRPEDGNHMGVSIHLDFVLLVPAVEDPAVEVGWGQDDLNIMSFAATGIGHPGVMSLAPNWEGVSEPTIFQDDAEGWAIAYVWDGLTLGFVVEGEGEH